MKTNKKTFRKIAGAATAAVLATCAIAPISVTNVSAASITITNSQAGHTYEAYQIFKGDLVDGKLSKIEWGDGVNSTNILGAVTALTPFSGCSSAADVAEKLATYKNKDAPDVVAFAEVVAKNLGSQTTYTPNATTVDGTTTYTIDLGNKPGYYLIKDASITNPENMSYTSYIVEVLGEKTNIAAKTGLPTFEKKVGDINDSEKLKTEAANYAFQDSADHDIGDTVPFKLTATVASDYDSYPKYKFVINDTLSSGLTFDSNSVEVYVDGTKINSGFVVDTQNVNSGETFEVEFADLKQIGTVAANSVITVTYNATLNENAVIGSVGNPNTANLEYSNNPNETDGSTMGHTPDDKVIVFTYETDILKVDDKNAALAGAKFSLYKYDLKEASKWKLVKTIDDTTNKNISTFKFTGLDDGYYKLVEDKAPEGFNTLKDPKYFKITASHSEEDKNPVLGELSATALSFDTDSETFSTNNITEPIQLTAKDFDTTVVPADTDSINDYLEGTIQNKSGSTLPSTGGIGTTPFYVGGGVLVAAAGVYIIVKKRMKNNDEEK